MRSNTGGLRVFPMHDWVGGRTSVMSAVGLLPAALLGFDIDDFLGGAAAMDAHTRVADVRKNAAMLLALMWYYAGNGRGEKDMVILPYKDRLALFSRYLQQLVMESLGKEKDRAGKIVHQGIAVYGNKGSTDQHAYVQQLRDGVPNFFVTFIEVAKRPRDIALRDRGGSHEPAIICMASCVGPGLPCMRRAVNRSQSRFREVNARQVGSLIALYERAVGFYGSLVNVNAYHQPGVEAGKKAATRLIDCRDARANPAEVSWTNRRATGSSSGARIRKMCITSFVTSPPTVIRLAAPRPKNPAANNFFHADVFNGQCGILERHTRRPME